MKYEKVENLQTHWLVRKMREELQESLRKARDCELLAENLEGFVTKFGESRLLDGWVIVLCRKVANRAREESSFHAEIALQRSTLIPELERASAILP